MMGFWRLIFFALFIGLVACEMDQIKKSTKPWPPKNENGETCISKECIAASHRIFELMNEKADPCQNFYEFACGGFIQKTIIPDDKSSASLWTPIIEKIEHNGKVLLEMPIDDKKDFESEKMAKVFYKSCMDQDKLDEIGLEQIKDIVSQAGGWPVVEGDSWKGEKFDVWKQSVKVYHMGYSSNYIATVHVATDAKNNSHRVLHFDQPQFGLSKDYWNKGLEEPEVKAYFTYMVETAVLFGADEDRAKEELEKVMKFEKKLADISARKEDRRNDTKLYNPTTLGELSESWTTYVSDLFHFDVFFKSLITITASEKVIIRDPKFYEQLSSVLQSTDTRTIANYMAWRMIKSSIKYLGKDARNIRQKFLQLLTGVSIEKVPWKRCTKKVGFNNQHDRETFNYAVGSMYARHIFDIEAKRQVDDMTGYIRKAFNEILQNVDWMDNDTKNEAFNKLEKLHQTLAYPVEYLDQKKIDGLHKGLLISKDDYLGNVLRLSVHFKKLQALKLRQTVDPYDWKDFKNVAIVNAHYDRTYNRMKYPAGILQGGFFNSKLPRYMNFGGIGMVIGHEITHGFDDKGRQRNSEGALVDWWKPETSEQFKEKAQCIIWQYGNYTHKQVGKKINGIITQGENIADNGGIKEAYLGYEKWVAENGDEPKLPGHGFSPKQLFWLSYAQTWCSKYRNASLKSRILRGPHSPPHFRVVGPLSNAEEFSKDWSCAIGSPMNPEKKCTVW